MSFDSRLIISARAQGLRGVNAVVEKMDLEKLVEPSAQAFWVWFMVDQLKNSTAEHEAAWQAVSSKVRSFVDEKLAEQVSRKAEGNIPDAHEVLTLYRKLSSESEAPKFTAASKKLLLKTLSILMDKSFMNTEKYHASATYLQNELTQLGITRKPAKSK